LGQNGGETSSTTQLFLVRDVKAGRILYKAVGCFRPYVSRLSFLHLSFPWSIFRFSELEMDVEKLIILD
jgi:hypothetical protein